MVKVEPKMVVKNEMIKITVVTVVKNGMDFIEQTINSVIDQNYNNFEYIIIDGGSTDGTDELIKSYGSRISKWMSEKDEGIADAFNKGLSLSSGDYILFLNSDDSLASIDALSTVAKQVVEHSFPMMIYGDCNVLDRCSDKIMYRASIEPDQKEILRGQMLPHPALFAHCSYFSKYGVFDNNFKIAMDYEWLLRGVLKENITHIPILVSNVRSGGLSTLNQSLVVDEIIAALKKNNYLATKFSELKLRGYFSSRAFVKYVLRSIGLYAIYFAYRNKHAKNEAENSMSTRRIL